ncbi:hypothetical protein ACMA46_12175 [Clavibacter sp. Sh2141]|uniref:hypothetical protein n=1 Tax=Clavibacter sp. Sh2141 TaxID=3395374 RepID=UPI0039BD2481
MGGVPPPPDETNTVTSSSHPPHADAPLRDDGPDQDAQARRPQPWIRAVLVAFLGWVVLGVG